MSKILHLENVKSYKTEANLMKKINEIYPRGPEYNDRCIITNTPDGRWTAIFVIDKNVGGYMSYFAQHEFMSV